MYIQTYMKQLTAGYIMAPILVDCLSRLSVMPHLNSIGLASHTSVILHLTTKLQPEQNVRISYTVKATTPWYVNSLPFCRQVTANELQIIHMNSA